MNIMQAVIAFGRALDLQNESQKILEVMSGLLQIYNDQCPGGGIGGHKDLKSLEGNFVPVQVRLWAPYK